MLGNLLPFLDPNALIRLEDYNKPEGENVIFFGRVQELKDNATEILDWNDPEHEWAIGELFLYASVPEDVLVLRIEK